MSSKRKPIIGKVELRKLMKDQINVSKQSKKRLDVPYSRYPFLDIL